MVAMITPKKIVILGGGPAGMATALSFIKAGFKVKVYERYPSAKPAGTLLNLWPPPIRSPISCSTACPLSGAADEADVVECE